MDMNSDLAYLFGAPDRVFELFEKHSPVEAPPDFAEEHFEDIKGLAGALNQYASMANLVSRLEPDRPHYEELCDIMAKLAVPMVADILYAGYLLGQKENANE